MRHRNETTPGAMTKLSMAGKAEIFIDGAGFDDLPVINSVQLKPTQNAEGALPMAGPPLDSKFIANTCQHLPTKARKILFNIHI